jgi:peroxiredoxin (alkyl hydroperoxide reductase subunit C)
LSVDPVFSRIKWTERLEEKLGVKTEFPIIADEMGEVGMTLGLIHPAKGTNTVRAVFIVDPKGKIRAILYYLQELGKNMDEILRMIKEFQFADKNGVAIPAGWPNNKIIGDHVIIPPVSDVKTAEERKVRKVATTGGSATRAYRVIDRL